MRRVRTVEISERVPCGKRVRVRLWAFGYRDLAALLGVTEQRVRVLVSRGRLDPASLEGVCRYWEGRRRCRK